MNRIFQKFLQSGINLFSMGAKCREDNTHDMDMNPYAENLHVAYSALHFKPVSDDIEWRIEFNIIRFSKKTFLLI